MNNGGLLQWWLFEYGIASKKQTLRKQGISIRKKLIYTNYLDESLDIATFL